MCLSVCFLTAAETWEYSLNLGDDFIMAEKGESVDEICALTGENKKSITDDFSSGGLLAIAVSKDAETQVKLHSFIDNFSATVQDISNLNEESLNEYAQSLSLKLGGDYVINNNNGRDYIEISLILGEGDDEYFCTQYLTICEGRVYCLTCYNNGEVTSPQANSAFKALNIEGSGVVAKDKSNKPEYILIGVGIGIFAVVAVWMIVGIIKDSRKQRGEKEQNQNKSENI